MTGHGTVERSVPRLALSKAEAAADEDEQCDETLPPIAPDGSELNAAGGSVGESLDVGASIVGGILKASREGRPS